MDLDSVSDKDLNELERLSRELLTLMGRAKLKNNILADMLDEFVRQAGEVRRSRFDASDSKYRSY
jgi:hypothetical protein